MKTIREIKELFGYRELIFTLTLKDLKVRYKNAAIGFGWMLLNPLCMMIIFSTIFKLVFKLEIAHYPIFLLSGLFPWTFFRGSLTAAATSIVDNANLVKKSCFPRVVIPISVVLANLINFGLSMVLLLMLILFSGIPLTASTLWLPVVIFIQVVFIIGISLIVSSLHVFYRDIRYIMEVVLSVWFFATPIVYSMDMVEKVLPSWVFTLYKFNPMVGIVRIYHDLLLFGQELEAGELITAFLISIAILVIGYFTFSRYEDVFADLV
jgi:ABC-2 type transport system permease protein